MEHMKRETTGFHYGWEAETKCGQSCWLPSFERPGHCVTMEDTGLRLYQLPVYSRKELDIKVEEILYNST